MVTVTIPSSMVAGSNHRSSIDLPASTVRELIDAASVYYPLLRARVLDSSGQLRLFTNIYVDGEECRTLGGLDLPLTDHAKVEVISAIAGG